MLTNLKITYKHKFKLKLLVFYTNILKIFYAGGLCLPQLTTSFTTFHSVIMTFELPLMQILVTGLSEFPLLLPLKKRYEQARIWEWAECGSEVKLYRGLLLRLAKTNVYEGKEYQARFRHLLDGTINCFASVFI